MRPTPAPGSALGTVTRHPFGRTPEGTPVERFVLANARGVEAMVLTYGAIVASLRVPDRDGRLGDVVLGFDTLDGYVHHRPSPYFGAVVGRYGNRIAGGRFVLDGVAYALSRNDGANHLHGGHRGFDRVVWQAEEGDDAAVRLAYTSPDGEEGYPGALTATVTYTLTPDDELVVDYAATTDRPTPVNLSQHTYFNLSGAGHGDILGHELTLAAGRFTRVGEGLIPTGELAAVDGTPLDFRRPHPIGARIDDPFDQLVVAGGYDHNFVLDAGGPLAEPAFAARVHDPRSGRVLEVYTTEPGVQLYTGNFLDGTAAGKDGHVYPRRSGLCLETQHFPDSPNHPHFPATILRPGTRYASRTVFRFRAA